MALAEIETVSDGFMKAQPFARPARPTHLKPSICCVISSLSDKSAIWPGRTYPFSARLIMFSLNSVSTAEACWITL